MHKLVEEAQELAEATHKDHIAAEAADLLYFAMVKCTAAGVTIPDIEVSFRSFLRVFLQHIGTFR